MCTLHTRSTNKRTINIVWYCFRLSSSRLNYCYYYPFTTIINITEIEIAHKEQPEASRPRGARAAIAGVVDCGVLVS